MFLEEVRRRELLRMMVWCCGGRAEFRGRPGKLGKYLQRQLEAALWEQWLQSCAGGSVEAHWAALEAICSLFRSVALDVAAHFSYAYPLADDERVSAYLRPVRALSPAAPAI